MFLCSEGTCRLIDWLRSLIDCSSHSRSLQVSIYSTTELVHSTTRCSEDFNLWKNCEFWIFVNLPLPRSGRALTAATVYAWAVLTTAVAIATITVATAAAFCSSSSSGSDNYSGNSSSIGATAAAEPIGVETEAITITAARAGTVVANTTAFICFTHNSNSAMLQIDPREERWNQQM